MSGSSLLSIGQSGLVAANLGLATTSHNIANVNTPGYSREQIIQQAALPGIVGQSGKGVDVVGVQRLASDFLTLQANLATSDSQSSSTQLDYLNRLSDLLTNDSTSMTSSLNTFFSSIQDLASNPSDATSRQTVLSDAQSLASRFKTLDGQLSSMTSEIGQRMQTTASDVNSLASSIAKLNDQIALQIGNGLQPNDLLDQRDQLINQLSKDARVNVLSQSDGRVNVFLASGDPLVLGGQSVSLSVQRDTSDPNKYVMTASGSATGGNTRTIQSGVDLGGTLGGLMATQTQIATARNELGRLSVVIGDALNTQQKLGQDLNGNAGTAMFAIGSPKAFALPGSTGAISVAYADTTALTGSDYQLSYDGSNYTLTKLADGSKQTFASLPQTVDGLTITATTAPAAGDAFVIQPTRDAASSMSMILSDTSLVAAAEPVMAQASTSNLGSGAVSSLTVNGPTRNANLTNSVSLSFTSASAFSITVNGVAAGTGSLASDGSFTMNGWTLKLSGTPSAGDTFTVAPNTSGTADNRNLLAMSNLTSTTLVNGKTVADANATFLGQMGNFASSMKTESSANDALLTQIQTQQQSVSGVNLDEEASNMLRYQQAYQAAAKVIATANQMFQSILNIAS